MVLRGAPNPATTTAAAMRIAAPAVVRTETVRTATALSANARNGTGLTGTARVRVALAPAAAAKAGDVASGMTGPADPASAGDVRGTAPALPSADIGTATGRRSAADADSPAAPSGVTAIAGSPVVPAARAPALHSTGDVGPALPAGVVTVTSDPAPAWPIGAMANTSGIRETAVRTAAVLRGSASTRRVTGTSAPRIVRTADRVGVAATAVLTGIVRTPTVHTATARITMARTATAPTGATRIAAAVATEIARSGTLPDAPAKAGITVWASARGITKNGVAATAVMAIVASRSVTIVPPATSPARIGMIPADRNRGASPPPDRGEARKVGAGASRRLTADLASVVPVPSDSAARVGAGSDREARASVRVARASAVPGAGWRTPAVPAMTAARKPVPARSGAIEVSKVSGRGLKSVDRVVPVPAPALSVVRNRGMNLPGATTAPPAPTRRICGPTGCC